MRTSQRILVYGHSVILGAIGISLRLYSQFEVTKHASLMQEPKTLDVDNTDIVIFDLETTLPEAVLPLLEINPNLQLIGISPDINIVRVWSVRELREASIQDLLQVIKNEAKDLPVKSCANELCSYRIEVNR